MFCLFLLSHLLSKVPKEWAGSNGRDQSSFGISGRASSCMECRVRFLNWPCARSREGTHDWVFLSIVKPEGLTCSSTSVVRANSPCSWLFNKYLLSISCMSNDSQLKTQSLLWNTPQSSIKQGNKAQYSVCILVAACARDCGITEAWR